MSAYRGLRGVANRPGLVIAGAALLVLVAGLAVWGLRQSGTPEGAMPESPEPEPAEEQGTTGDDAADGRAPDDDPDDGTSEPIDRPEEDVPQHWEFYADPTIGFRLTYPPDWEVVTVDDTITDFRDPGSHAYLRVDWTDEPPEDPVTGSQQQSQELAERHDGYEEIRIEPTVFRGYEAALWEYRYAADGLPVRGYRLGIATPPYEQVLSFQTSGDRWEDDQSLWDAFQEVFHPGGVNP